MDAPTLKKTGVQLSQLKSGQRAWFWFCEQTESVEPPLLLTAVADDPGMTQLVDQINQIQIPRDAIECVGLVSVDDTGRLMFGSQDASEQTLTSMAEWCRNNTVQQPSLARLAGACMVRFNDNRRVLERWEDPGLWGGLSRPVVPGTLAASATILDALDAGDGAWFWLTTQGPGRCPFLAMKPQADDVTGQDFAKDVRALVQRSPEASGGVAGYVRLLKTGKLIFVIDQDTSLAVAALQALATRPAFKRLHGAVVLRKSDSGFNQGKAIAPLDFSSQAALLSGLAPGGALPFWFTDMASDGLQRMLIAPEGGEEKLLEAALSAAAVGGVAEGVITMADTGELSMFIEDPFPGAVQHIAAWVSAHLEGYPVLINLVGIHAFTLDADGTQVTLESASWDGLIDWDTIAAEGE